MNDAATELVIALAKHVITYMQTTFPGWKDVYVRIDAPDDSQFGVRASYVTASGIELVSTMHHRGLSDGVLRIGSQLREALSNNERKFCVGLFRANSLFRYHIDFEWNDASKWNITKLNGASGLPVGLEKLAPLD